MKQGWSTAVVTAVAAVAGPASVPPNTVPPNTVIVSAAAASERISQEVTALAGTA